MMKVCDWLGSNDDFMSGARSVRPKSDAPVLRPCPLKQTYLDFDGELAVKAAEPLPKPPLSDAAKSNRSCLKFFQGYLSRLQAENESDWKDPLAIVKLGAPMQKRAKLPGFISWLLIGFERLSFLPIDAADKNDPPSNAPILMGWQKHANVDVMLDRVHASVERTPEHRPMLCLTSSRNENDVHNVFEPEVEILKDGQHQQCCIKLTQNSSDSRFESVLRGYLAKQPGSHIV